MARCGDFRPRVGLSRYTGAVTHHIAPDVDAERTLITADLQAAGMVEARYQVTGTGPTLLGRNGEGDPYRTDGEVWVLRLVEGAPGALCRRWCSMRRRWSRPRTPSGKASPASIVMQDADGRPMRRCAAL